MKQNAIALGTAVLLLMSGGNCKRPSGFPNLEVDYLGQAPPGMTAEIFAPGIISHGFHENGVFFSPDGSELFYSTSDSQYAFKTFVSLKRNDGRWSAPEMAPFSGDFYTHSAFFSPDGGRIYFSSKRPVVSTEDKPDLDVWYIERDGLSWGRPAHLKGPLNTDKNEQITSIAANGTIYLRANDEGGRWSIYLSRWDNGLYSAAERLSDTINKGYNEGNP